MKALITAGGRATRMRPITHTINKHLIPMANRPMIENAILKIAETGITDIAININEGDTEIPKVLGDGSNWNVQLTYIEQMGGPKGLAHIIHNARDWIKSESLLFFLGDNIILGSIIPFVEEFKTKNLDCLLALSRVSDPQRFGVPEIINGVITRVIEKPQEPPSPFAVTGIYAYSPKILEAVAHIQPSARGEFEISDAHTWLIEHGAQVGYQEITGWWKDTGLPQDLIEGNALMLDQMHEGNGQTATRQEKNISIQGIVSIGKDVTFGQDVLIRGPVVIGSNCHLENCYIGPYTSIGTGSRIVSAEIEHSILFNAVEIQQAGRIVDSIIGEKARISAASLTLPRCGHRLVVGDNSSVEL
ncbi:glucose-1-phosphate thymidylyltransferase [Candidatus Uhrbacteria bacterium]|nr:glucose-1-phosphate thymidylyltransferase [Candidatus Uhrbacteria bacterium]